eukprot:TRINITY_DN11114_c1_g3_i1.p1 TRINITY_DN11114_c1_g3~~TRINITY_DN11114_c1_g3_i1.p1  ORF type:complete len:407 (-),score=44.79 TRINITY_DN11114_c1_g3_i1:135-1334(-)
MRRSQNQITFQIVLSVLVLTLIIVNLFILFEYRDFRHTNNKNNAQSQEVAAEKPAQLQQGGSAAPLPPSLVPTLQNNFFDDQHLEQIISTPKCKKIVWVVGLSWHPNNHNRVNQIKYALTTKNLRAPSLVSMVLYQGPMNNPFISWLQNHGSIVCAGGNSIVKELEEAGLNEQFQGIYFRLVVNEYVDRCLKTKSSDETGFFADQVDLDYVLYTDTDVGFFDDINSCNIFKPKILSFGAEVDRPQIWNTGIIIFNVTAYKNTQPGFFKFCRTKNWKGDNWEQELYQIHYRDRGLVDELPDEYNWKPYWGRPKKRQFKILHYHGPKPGMECLECLMTKQVRKTNETHRSCEDTCVYNYELMFTKASKDNFWLYENLMREWKKIAYAGAPYFDNEDNRLIE